MGLNFTGNPTFDGKIVAKIPTPTYSGTSDNIDGSTSINPYTDYGPSGFQSGTTESAIDTIQSGGTPRAIPTTWNSLDKGTGFALSNDNTTVTHSGPADYEGGVRSVHGVTSGKYYWEASFSGAGSTHLLMGISESSVSTANSNKMYNAEPTGSIALFLQVHGYGYTGSTQAPWAGAFSTGSVVGFALDMDIKAFWVSRDGVWVAGATITEVENGITTNAFPYALTGSEYFATFGDANAVSNSWEATANFGQSAFVHTPPAGFLLGFGIPE